jgi:hydroxymethylpyrimidine/phosphomethylpyrimidine kinase
VSLPTVVVCAGVDPTGRAGLLADLETLRGFPVLARGVVTALTAQGGDAFGSWPTAPSVLRAQLKGLRAVSKVRAVKLGMVPTKSVMHVLREGLAEARFWVVDPLTRTSRGERLSSLRRGDWLALAGPRVVLTPNADETLWLVGRRRRGTASVEALAEAAERLCAHGFGAVVAKGGHLDGAPIDVIATRAGLTLLEGARLPRDARRHRGTGCRFASALAARLALGDGVLAAALAAKETVQGYLRSSSA